MELDSQLYDLTQNLQGALFSAGMKLAGDSVPPPNANPLLLVRRGYAESAGWFLVQAEEFAPEPLSVERIRGRAVWSSPQIVAALLDLMMCEKWLDRRGPDYYLTEEGQAVLDYSAKRRWSLLTPLEESDFAAEIAAVEAMTSRLIEASLTHAEPPGTWSLGYSIRRTPSNDAPASLKLFQQCADFNAYRDDSHMAAFMPLGVPAYAWEAFTLIWQGAATDANSAYDQLPHRGYAREDFSIGLRELSERGWLKIVDGEQYAPTDEGKRVREQAEKDTNTYFFAPWLAQGEAFVAEFSQRMHDLNAGLEALAAT